MKVGLYITLEPDHGNPITLARVKDRELLNTAALAAVWEAERRASQTASADRIMGELQRQEAQRLRGALELVIPAIRSQEPSAATA